ncbi:MAG TPA: protein YgfX [Rhodocyclaceae bacterium]
MRLPLTVILRPSATLTVVLFSGHALAAAVLLPLALPGAAKLLLWVLLLASCIREYRRQRRYTALRLLADGQALLPADDERPWRVDGQSLRLAWLVVLTLRRDKQRVSLALPVDALGAEAHRQLRLWLGWLVQPTEDFSDSDAGS